MSERRKCGFSWMEKRLIVSVRAHALCKSAESSERRVLGPTSGRSWPAHVCTRASFGLASPEDLVAHQGMLLSPVFHQRGSFLFKWCVTSSVAVAPQLQLVFGLSSTELIDHLKRQAATGTVYSTSICTPTRGLINQLLLIIYSLIILILIVLLES